MYSPLGYQAFSVKLPQINNLNYKGMANETARATKHEIMAQRFKCQVKVATAINTSGENDEGGVYAKTTKLYKVVDSDKVFAGALGVFFDTSLVRMYFRSTLPVDTDIVLHLIPYRGRDMEGNRGVYMLKPIGDYVIEDPKTIEESNKLSEIISSMAEEKKNLDTLRNAAELFGSAKANRAEYDALLKDLSGSKK